MRPLKHIVILVEPGQAGVQTDGSPSPTLRQFDQYDRFAAELQQRTNACVELVERALDDVPQHDLLLIAYHSNVGNALQSVGYLVGANHPRPILLNVDYKEAFALGEIAQPAAIVPGERFVRWSMRQDSRVFRQIYGLKSLASAVSPLLKPTSLGESEHYCLYVSEQILSLPEVLIFYIEAYWKGLS